MICGEVEVEVLRILLEVYFWDFVLYCFLCFFESLEKIFDKDMMIFLFLDYEFFGVFNE